jgi:hypothetical protein
LHWLSAIKKQALHIHLKNIFIIIVYKVKNLKTS